MSVSHELKEVGYPTIRRVRIADYPTFGSALGRSLRELNGVGYHSEILATPATALSPSLRAEGTGLSIQGMGRGFESRSGRNPDSSVARAIPQTPCPTTRSHPLYFAS